MRAVIQKVTEASVTVDGEIVGQIGDGLLVLLGIKPDDTDKDIDYIIDKITNVRIFRDDEDKMNLSVSDTGGELLIVSQFTLYDDARKGRRPSFDRAAGREISLPLYERFLEKLSAVYDKNKIQTGKFAAMMDVALHNDGPCTILLDSERGF